MSQTRFDGELDGNPETKIATATVRGMRFGKFVAGGVQECDTAGEKVDCIIAFDALVGVGVTCYTTGARNKVTAGAALTQHGRVATDAQARAIPQTAEHAFQAGYSNDSVSGAGLVAVIALEPLPVTAGEVP